MTAMISGCDAGACSAASFVCLVPVGGCETDRLAGFHGGETGEDVFEVFPRVQPQTAAVLDEGVDDRGFLSGVFGSDEEPVLGSELGGADGVFDEVMPRPDLCRVRQAGGAHSCCLPLHSVFTRGIIKGSPERRAADRVGDNVWGPLCSLSLVPTPSPSSPCRHGGRCGWSGLTHGLTKERSR